MNSAEFNILMEKATQTVKAYPDASVDTIATLVCSTYHNHEKYAEILFQVTYALVNLKR